MQQARDICDTVFKNGAAVFMARIVDGTGVRVRRDQIAFITFTAREIDLRNSEKFKRVVSPIDAMLDVDEVFSDSLQIDGLWDVDTVGYNFRHEIRADRSRTFPKPGACYEIRYVLWPKDCAVAQDVRFYLRSMSK
jgi:hypothetical protein